MKLEGKIGLPGGIALVVGGVIGMGVYAMIPSIAAKSGEAVWLSILIAMVVSLLSVLPLIQLSSALPVAGGGYMWCSRMLHPAVGLLVSWWAMIGGGSSVCVVATGLADMLMPFVPFTISVHLLAALLIISFYFTYFFGIRLLTTLQLLMSVQLVIALAAYTFFIFGSGDAELTVGMPTNPKFAFSIILAFNVCIGFQIITEMGEDIKDAKKNIPLSLLFGSIIIILIYLAISFSYVSVVGLDNLEAALESNSPLMNSAEPYLSPFWLWFLGLGGIFAGLTSFNAGAIALPRELFSQARDMALPESFAKLTPGTKSPMRAVTLFFAVVVFFLVSGHFLDSSGTLEKFNFSNPIDFYGFMAVCGIMLLTVFISVAAFRLPKLFPDHYSNAYFKLSKPALYTLVGISVLTSAAFVLLLGTESLLIPIIYSLFTVLILAYFFYRKKQLAQKGLEMGNVYNMLDDVNEHQH